MPGIRGPQGAAAYVENSLSTASPARLVVMLYDRLVLDLDRAETALRSGGSASEHLLHAQDIVMELLTSLDTTAWDGANRLAGIYTFLHTRLVHANVDRDADAVTACAGLVGPLRDAWRDAAMVTAIPAQSNPADRGPERPLLSAIA